MPPAPTWPCPRRVLRGGGFDEGFAVVGAAGEDIDLSWRLQLSGHRLHFEPGALVHYRHPHDLREVWRQNLHYGLADVLLYKRYRAHGVLRRPLGQALRGFRGLLVRTPDLMRRAHAANGSATPGTGWAGYRAPFKRGCSFSEIPFLRRR